MAMLTERFAGGRGTALETQTAVRAKPRRYDTRYLDQNPYLPYIWVVEELTRVSVRHEEQCYISTSYGRRRQTDNVADHDTPPPSCNVEVAFSGAI